jgi:hypothetical protein
MNVQEREHLYGQFHPHYREVSVADEWLCRRHLGWLSRWTTNAWMVRQLDRPRARSFAGKGI